ncbi:MULTISPECIES: 16S rRNA (guanine(527)-N(7))-methyltransferase RsmG [Delftia]|jgi:16S rRNA (guanine527-N7)-methyltransferase|uniref:Ribosomal RNA small subunit methyltransferase G n=1 Tax=Delftia acidovorans (strain DSM 14801 / SPH-1) TaxID=398578 RepID=A9BQJ2_DELAS|nr:MULTISPECIES: 16S rRNA (guanine(527)-N(7))-methyltransferase RsmG [Delftia]MBA4006672.1 16S rRNA (guanine(527)-N(7))-methyltransferase RsmG [Delftia sp.]ABX32694.1 methyltransferase GidB [Delftia acidovorans SPH-1]MBN9323338.1 16S rRNA (guanine(527)-N(7))-methyltransferase RsmG [Delftia acidovorans]MBO0987368.1 16S rRNA (guanine(527)-N(7))-methyltransferase RsmG [Delftia sp. SD083]MBO1033153.1 16S rRNA (guanine(527)-N(7))-methyltransferase RsmG [Delftia sp. SD018]
MSQELRAPLEAGLQALGLDLTPAQIDTLMEFQALLGKWNKVYNLTAVRDPQEMLTHHLLDSLAAVPALQRHLAQMPAREGRTAMLDVGSGGGLPGVVFAICCPQIDVHCVDTVGKKAAFIQQAAATLRLPNLRGIHSRVEQLTTRYPLISCRAFASLADFTSWSRQALEEGGTWLAMKGKHPDDEIAALPADVQVFHVEPLKVPGLDAERCILWLRVCA